MLRVRVATLMLVHSALGQHRAQLGFNLLCIIPAGRLCHSFLLSLFISKNLEGLK